LYPYFVTWAKGRVLKEECLTIAQLKTLFPGKFRQDLKVYVEKTRHYWNIGDNRGVKIMGSHKRIHALPARPLESVPAIPVASSMHWQP